MQTIIQTYYRLIERTNFPHRRYLYNAIHWQERLIGIKGARGVGKTTILLQHIHDCFPDRKKALYVSLDQLWFSEHSIMELAEYHYTHGGTHLFLDEVHRYQGWVRELKNIYDSYPELNVVFTGSSLLELDSSVADLSRRCRMYEMKGLSFREYLSFQNAISLQPVTLIDILDKHEQIAASLTAQIKVLPLFEEYLSRGYYPFYHETDAEGFRERLERIVMTVLENDIPAMENLEYETIYKTKRLMVILAEMVPFTLNVTTLCSTLGMSRNQLIRLLSLLERSALIRQLFTEAKGLKQLVKPEKILFENPNLMYALSPQVEAGTLRETFFASMLSHSHKLQAPKVGDFLVDGSFLFEIGGKGKGFKQIRNIENSYVAADGIEIGYDNKIPLWLFGLMY